MHLLSEFKGTVPLTLLLTHLRIDVNIKNHYPNTPLPLALYYRRPEKLRPLLGHKCINTALLINNAYTLLHITAMVGLSDMLQDELKKNTADVNNLDRDGLIALHYAVLHNFIDFVTLLLADQNVNLNIRYRLWLISTSHPYSERQYVKLLNSCSQICVWM